MTGAAEAGGHLADAYPEEFYADLHEVVARSARTIAPRVVELLRPTSVVDVGCGTGTWLAAFADLGVERLVGVDGGHVDRRQLEIPEEQFRCRDLEQSLALEDRDGPFDLVVSLEVAEHLPAARAEGFVEDLVALGPVVLFSAAIPGQGGAHHVNEQWPGYWSAMFHGLGYEAIDALRPALWSDLEIAPWYAQNILLYADLAALDEHDAERLAGSGRRGRPHAVVHPDVYESVRWQLAVEHVRTAIGSLAAPGDTVVLLDGYGLGIERLPAQDVLPFPSDGDAYLGPPADDEQARAALAGLDRLGARVLVVSRDMEWWLDEYPGFADALATGWTRQWQGELGSVYSRT